MEGEPLESTPKPARPVLICDDDWLLVKLMRHALERRGFAVLSAHNGQDGLAVIREHAPAVVLLDIDMPILDGLDVLRSLRERPPARSPTVIVVSNHEDHQVHALCESLGARAILIKPVNIGTLHEIIDRYMREAPQ